MNWPDDDFIFQQQKIEIRRILLSFFRSLFFFVCILASTNTKRQTNI
jgi:hypothetical protein